MSSSAQARARRRAGWFAAGSQSGRWLVVVGGATPLACKLAYTHASCTFLLPRSQDPAEFQAVMGSLAPDASHEFEVARGSPDQDAVLGAAPFDAVVIEASGAFQPSASLISDAAELVGEGGRLGISLELAGALDEVKAALDSLRTRFAPMRIDLTPDEILIALERGEDSEDRWGAFDKAEGAALEARRSGTDATTSPVAEAELTVGPNEEDDRVSQLQELEEKHAAELAAAQQALEEMRAEKEAEARKWAERALENEGRAERLDVELRTLRTQQGAALTETAQLRRSLEALRESQLEDTKQWAQRALDGENKAAKARGEAAALASSLELYRARYEDEVQARRHAEESAKTLENELAAQQKRYEALEGRQKEDKVASQRALEQAEAQARELRHRLAQAEAQFAEARKTAAQRDKELERVYSSTRYRLGTRIVETAKIGVSLVRPGRKPAKPAKRENPAGETAKIDSQRESAPAALSDSVPAPAQKPKMAIVADTFTTSCFEPDVRPITLDIKDFANQLRQEKPDLVFVESAWAGNKGSWQYRVAKYNRNMGDELRDLVAAADESRVPSVFWNKEDPVHFDRFIDSARRFDVILTTDETCVPRYVETTGKNRVFAMPFAAQPEIHHPVTSKPRLDKPCFAGTYYGSRHGQRSADLEHLLDPARDFGLHIYDRRHGYTGKDADQFRFPDRYQPFIQGKLAYDEMVEAYRSYRVFLNVNSVTESKTMFSRRVFELLACGTPVVSSYSAGVEDLLGDVVYISRNGRDTYKALETLIHDDDAWARASIDGIRAVLDKHTYRHRLKDLMKHADLPPPADRREVFIASIKLESDDEAERAAEMLARQKRKPDILIVLSGKAGEDRLQALEGQLNGGKLVKLAPETSPGELAARLNTVNGAYYFPLSAHDGYGPHFFSDLEMSLQYARPDYFGRHTYFAEAAEGGTIGLRNPGWEQRYVKAAPSASIAARCGSLESGEINALLNRFWFKAPETKTALSLSRFGYLHRGAQSGYADLSSQAVGAALEIS